MPMRELPTTYEGDFLPTDRANLLEVIQRMRRVETRLTRLLETEGIATGVQRPWFMADGIAVVPSSMTTIDAILKVIPENWPKKMAVQVDIKESQSYVTLCRILL